MSDHSIYPNTAGIYKLTCEVNGKVYIGKSNNIRQRLYNHQNCAKTFKGKCHFEYALQKYGWESFSVEILELVDESTTNKDLLEREAFYIQSFNATDRTQGYNRCSFSNDVTGYVMSDENRKKLSERMRGKVVSVETKERMRISATGRKMSEEAKANMSKARKGKKISEKAKANMKGMLGKSHNDETKKKISESLRGRKHSEEMKLKISEGLKKRYNQLKIDTNDK